MRTLVLLGIAVLLSACGGQSDGGQNVGEQNRGPAAVATQGEGIPNAAAIDHNDAIRVARHERIWNRPIALSASALDFSSQTAAPQTLKVSANYPAIVYVASSNERIFTVSPSLAYIPGAYGGSVTFTISPREPGRADLGIIDTALEGSVVPVTTGETR